MITFQVQFYPLLLNFYVILDWEIKKFKSSTGVKKRLIFQVSQSMYELI